MQYEKLYADLITDLRHVAKQHDQEASKKLGAGMADWVLDQQIAREIHRITYRAAMAQEVPQ